MPYWLLLDPCKYPIGDLTLTFVVDSGNLPFGARPQKLIELDSFSVGSDRDNEVIFYPNNFDVEIKTEEDFEDWLTILKDLSLKETLAMIEKDGDYIFRGSVQKSSVKGDMFRRSLGFRAVDQIMNLKNFDPADNDLNYVLDETHRITSILQDIFTSGIYFPDGTAYINGVVSLCTYEANVNSNYYNFSDFGVRPYNHYFSSGTPYDTVLDVVKQILVTYGLVAFVGFDRKLYLIPRVYQNNTVHTIQNNEIADIETNIMRGMEGLKLYVRTGASAFTYQTYNYGDVITNPDRVEEIRIDQAVGSLPAGGGYSGLELWTGAAWEFADINTVRRKEADGSYTTPTSLWRLTGDDTWSIIQKDRMNYKVTLKGSFDALTHKSDLLSTHNPKQFYKLAQFPDEYLRPRRLKYDLNDNSVEIDLLSN